MILVYKRRQSAMLLHAIRHNVFITSHDLTYLPKRTQEMNSSWSTPRCYRIPPGPFILAKRACLSPASLAVLLESIWSSSQPRSKKHRDRGKPCDDRTRRWTKCLFGMPSGVPYGSHLHALEHRRRRCRASFVIPSTALAGVVQSHAGYRRGRVTQEG